LLKKKDNTKQYDEVYNSNTTFTIVGRKFITPIFYPKKITRAALLIKEGESYN
jgi:hypothetical protein